MTELQYGLIGLGATAIVGVLAYNKWQEHKHRKVAEQVLKARHADVLLDAVAPGEEPSGASGGEAPGEPALGAVYADVSDERTEPVLRLDPRLEPGEPSLAGEVESETQAALAVADYEMPSVEAFAEPRPPRPAEAGVPPAVQPPEAAAARELAREPRDTRESAPPHHLLSPLIDFVAAFEAVEPAPAYQILEAQQAALARVRKPIHWIGYNERSREWEPVIDDGDSEYRRIRIALQLVDRNGPASDSDLSTFCLAMQDLSDELMAVADLPPRQPALDAALQLDQFCAGVDIQIGINVVAQGQAFPGTKLRALAEAAGMALDPQGCFVRCDDEGNVLYTLTNQEAGGFPAESMKTLHTHGVTFLLDVPRVAHGDRVFNQMVDLARRFAEALHGALVDDNRRPLSEGALEPIRRQVAQYQAAMASRQIPAGGPLALRLFA